MNILETSVKGLRLERPGIVASGIMDETGEAMARMLKLGAGAAVTKSIGSVARSGHGNPTFVEYDFGCVNAMGLPNPGIDEYGDEMKIAVNAGKVIGSVFASSAEEFAILAAKMESYKASAVELNLSCPHAQGYGMEMGIDTKMVHKIVSKVKDAVKIPVLAKLTPNTHILTDIGRTVQDAGGDGVVAINTLRAMSISPELARPVLYNRFGGLSGPAVRPVGVRAVYDLYAVLDIPVIGVGGICDWRDAAEYIMAGASAFQVGTAIGKDVNVFEKINSGLSKFMKEHGYSSIKKMTGAAHE